MKGTEIPIKVATFGTILKCERIARSADKLRLSRPQQCWDQLEYIEESVKTGVKNFANKPRIVPPGNRKDAAKVPGAQKSYFT